MWLTYDILIGHLEISEHYEREHRDNGQVGHNRASWRLPLWKETYFVWSLLTFDFVDFCYTAFYIITFNTQE